MEIEKLIQVHRCESVSLMTTLFQQHKDLWVRNPREENNSQDICTRLQIEMKPPAEMAVSALTLHYCLIELQLLGMLIGVRLAQRFLRT